MQTIHQRSGVANDVIRTTENHPFYVKGKGWVQATDLMPGDELRDPNGRYLKVRKTVDSGQTKPVFNLQIAGAHTYFVTLPQSGNAVLVHNDSTNAPSNDDWHPRKELTGASAFADSLFRAFFDHQTRDLHKLATIQANQEAMHARSLDPAELERLRSQSNSNSIFVPLPLQAAHNGASDTDAWIQAAEADRAPPPLASAFGFRCDTTQGEPVHDYGWLGNPVMGWTGLGKLHSGCDEAFKLRHGGDAAWDLSLGSIQLGTTVVGTAKVASKVLEPMLLEFSTSATAEGELAAAGNWGRGVSFPGQVSWSGWKPYYDPINFRMKVLEASTSIASEGVEVHESTHIVQFMAQPGKVFFSQSWIPGSSLPAYSLEAQAYKAQAEFLGESYRWWMPFQSHNMGAAVARDSVWAGAAAIGVMGYENRGKK